MAETTTTVNGGGIGFTGALTILFIALKLTGVIGWSWWWVLSPLLISGAFAVLVFVLFFGGFFLYHWRKDVKRHQAQRLFNRRQS